MPTLITQLRNVPDEMVVTQEGNGTPFIVRRNPYPTPVTSLPVADPLLIYLVSAEGYPPELRPRLCTTLVQIAFSTQAAFDEFVERNLPHTRKTQELQQYELIT